MSIGFKGVGDIYTLNIKINQANKVIMAIIMVIMASMKLIGSQK